MGRTGLGSSAVRVIAVLRLFRNRHAMDAVAGNQDGQAPPGAQQPLKKPFPERDSPAADNALGRRLSADADSEVVFHPALSPFRRADFPLSTGSSRQERNRMVYSKSFFSFL